MKTIKIPANVALVLDLKVKSAKKIKIHSAKIKVGDDVRIQTYMGWSTGQISKIDKDLVILKISQPGRVVIIPYKSLKPLKSEKGKSIGWKCMLPHSDDNIKVFGTPKEALIWLDAIRKFAKTKQKIKVGDFIQYWDYNNKDNIGVIKKISKSKTTFMYLNYKGMKLEHKINETIPIGKHEGKTLWNSPSTDAYRKKKK